MMAVICFYFTYEPRRDGGIDDKIKSKLYNEKVKNDVR